jgi:hypothetical protein
VYRGVISTLDGTAGQNAGGGGLHHCTVPGCSRSYKTPGWLARHLKSSHGLAVPNDPITPPSAVIADVGLPMHWGDGERRHFGWSEPKCGNSEYPCVLLRQRRKWSDRGSTKLAYRWTGGMHLDAGF